MEFESWGRVHRAEHRVTRLDWRTDSPDWLAAPSLLPRACGRSYGDSCLNEGGGLILTRGLNRIIEFRRDIPSIRCEAGLTLDELLRFIVPRGFFLPVTPGTKHVSIGGAIANDVHGKNHHVAGNFGNHVIRLELLRSDNARLECSPSENQELFSATIGGLGLTGVILSAEFRILPIVSTAIDVEKIRFERIEEFFSLSEESDGAFDYTVAWSDWASGSVAGFGRGVFMRGNHSPEGSLDLEPHAAASFPVPNVLPNFLLSRAAIRLHNMKFLRDVRDGRERSVEHYDKFFYPLDRIANWNRLYGPRGLFQHQSVLPVAAERDGLGEISSVIIKSSDRPYLVVLKRFGDLPARGMMSFPRAGTTIALDFPNNGRPTLDLLDRLDQIVVRLGGAVYPAKDARMSQESFRRFFPMWREFLLHVDPKFSSSFWRRCAG